MTMRRTMLVSLIASAFVGGLVGCGGGGGGATATPPAQPPSVRTTGYAVPTEISPVAPRSAVQPTAFKAALARAALAATDPGTDYGSAVTSRYVSEHAIDQFSIIETILNAISQTHYADAENVNAGPYKSIVTWQENSGGNNNAITTQTWVVDSKVFQEGGQDVNRVDAWIEEEGRLIRGQFRITAPATQRSDGSYVDYGTWSLNVKFDDAGSSYFEALADIDGNGDTILKINNHEEHGGLPYDRRGVVHKGAAAGYGKVYYTEDYNGSVVATTAAYAYNGAQLLVNDGSGDRYKDRAATVDIVQRYGMYRADTGADVLKDHTFGFPVSFTLAGRPSQGYYGAWQGRHSLWVNGGGSVPEGTTLTVTSQDPKRPGTWSTASFTGTLSKRTLKTADLNDLLDLPAEIWTSVQHNLRWDGSQWTEDGAPFTDFASLVAQTRMNVMISGWSLMSGSGNYVYDPDGPAGAGFYLASMGPNNTWVRSSSQCYQPSLNDSLWINLNGSIYIEYKGNGSWVRKQVTAFDPQTCTPTFDAAGDTPFSPAIGFQYYINKQGGNYVVTRTSADSYEVQVEIQTAANPVNVTDAARKAEFFGNAVTFRPQWGGGSTFRFDADPASPTFMKLVYATVASPDTAQAGDPVTTGQWGLAACDGGGQSLGVQYNWDYPQQGQSYGVQTFLYTLDGGQNRVYKLLDDPIALAPLGLHTSGGLAKTLSLQFDGWMQGLPQFYDELARNNWNLTDAVAAKVVNIPAGTAATDALEPSVSYLIKPLEVGVYLMPAATPDPTLTLASADAIHLTDPGLLPQYSDNGMGAEPSVSQIKYIGGIKVQVP
jgi:hypothetical protein